MNNGFGSGIVFSCIGMTISNVTGSITSWDLQKSAEKKEITDGTDAFKYVGIAKRKKVVKAEILFTGSGSAVTIPEVGDTATLVAPWSGDVSGNWGVTDSSIKARMEDAVVSSIELTQWYTTNTGTTTIP